MKKLAIAILALSAIAGRADACTSLVAAKGATADGSTMVTYAADSHSLYGELYYEPGAEFPEGTMRPVVEWDTGKYLGEIPQVSRTYTRIGNMNEKGVTIAESTWGGRHELAGSGMIDYGSLIYITLERAATAREALRTMIDLVDKYGYASEGESFSIADPDEVWILELVGKGKDDPGAVWVARRVPDGYISGHANNPRIHQFPLDDPETLYSPDVIEFARRQGYYDGKDEDFSFSRAYQVYDWGALRGCDGRVWSYFNRFSPEQAQAWLQWVLKGEGDVMPLWIKPDKPLTANDMKWMMRDHFEGTPMDMTQDIGAGPFDLPYRFRPMSFKVDGVEYFNERAIATQQTGFSFVASMNADRHKDMRGILWFGVDDANTCVYIPVFSSATSVPYEISVGNGDMNTLSWDAMFWVNNYVANQAYGRYSLMIDDIRKVQSAIEETLEAGVAERDAACRALPEQSFAESLNAMTAEAAASTTKRYKQLGDYLFVKYLDGNRKKEADGQFLRNEAGMPAYPEFPGYNERYYRSIADDAGERLKAFEVKQ